MANLEGVKMAGKQKAVTFEMSVTIGNQESSLPTGRLRALLDAEREPLRAVPEWRGGIAQGQMRIGHNYKLMIR